MKIERFRSKLNNMTDRMMMRLHDRSGFPLNLPVYQMDAISVTGRNGISFLEFAIEGLEAYHATLGRYQFKDQYKLSNANLPPSHVQRAVGEIASHPVDLDLRKQLLTFYRHDLLAKLCEIDDEPESYGETVYIDADLLVLIFERINLGRHIAAAKVRNDPELWAFVDDTDKLTCFLKDRNREEEVIRDACEIAVKYEIDPELGRFIFSWVIEKTLSVEVNYLQWLAKQQKI